MLMLCALSLAHGTGLDFARHQAILRKNHPDITLGMKILTNSLIPVLYLFYAWYLWTGIQRRDAARKRFVIVFIAVQIAMAFLVVRALKITVGKPRPDQALMGAGYEPFSFQHGQHSFPSGHTTDAVSVTGPLAVRWKNAVISLALGCIASLVAYTRLYLGMHHMTDLMAGACLGILANLLVHYFAHVEHL
jgi:undecaprenyl-diphosphatase